MTEQEWMACAEPIEMLRFVQGQASDRKLRLIACGSCQRIWELIRDKKSRKAVLTSEAFADGLVDSDALAIASRRLRYSLHGIQSRAQLATSCAIAAACATTNPSAQVAAEMAILTARSAVEWHGGCSASIVEQSAQANLIRDLFGPILFKHIELNSNWITTTVIGLAQAIYTSRAFDRMPILADALMDVGCDNVDLITHLRNSGFHYKGCWAVDVILHRNR